jgi:hypothetical protein
MRIKHFLYILLITGLVTGGGCKAKKCPTYDGDGAKHHVNYGKKGLVKKKNKGPSRTWDSNY